MTNPHTEELKRRMGAMTPGPYGDDTMDRNGQRILTGEIEVCTFWHHSVGALEKKMNANSEGVLTALNITAFLASDGAEEAFKREVLAHVQLVGGDEKYLDGLAAALIELLAEKGCG